ncbi:MAG TPA: serine/threonine-protein kinase [Polyangiaceae bacterium]
MRSARISPQSEPAAHLGKYRLIAELAHGGMGIVHLAVLKGLAGFTKLLVVKELRAELAHDDAFVAMFFDEARVAARLSHPNIVQTIELGTQDQRHFLAMEYVEGPSLQKFARRARRRGKPVPLAVHLYVLIEILSALEYAHSLTERDGTPTGLVHRDVSPHNVLVSYDGHVKLVDFGIAQTAAAGDATHAGVLKGKMMYMAPEQAACEPVDRRADVFSAGLMLWEAIVGRQPWEGQSDGAILRRLLAGEIPRVRDALPEVDATLMTIVDRATSAEPADRYPTALAMRNDLEKYRSQLDAKEGALEVGAFLSELFAEDRERLRKVIDNRIRLMAERGRAATAVPAPVPEEPPKADPGVQPPSLAPSAMWIPAATPPARRGGWFVAAALVVAAAVSLVARGRAANDASMESVARALWPDVDVAPTAARAPATGSTSVIGPRILTPREEHVGLTADSPAPVHEAASDASARADAAAPPDLGRP